VAFTLTTKEIDRQTIGSNPGSPFLASVGTPIRKPLHKASYIRGKIVCRHCERWTQWDLLINCVEAIEAGPNKNQRPDPHVFAEATLTPHEKILNPWFPFPWPKHGQR
jgi:hypothetical protein